MTMHSSDEMPTPRPGSVAEYFTDKTVALPPEAAVPPAARDALRVLAEAQGLVTDAEASIRRLEREVDSGRRRHDDAWKAAAASGADAPDDADLRELVAALKESQQSLGVLQARRGAAAAAFASAAAAHRDDYLAGVADRIAQHKARALEGLGGLKVALELIDAEVGGAGWLARLHPQRWTGVKYHARARVDLEAVWPSSAQATIDHLAAGIELAIERAVAEVVPARTPGGNVFV